MKEKYKAVLQEVLANLRSIELPNVADSYIDDSIRMILEVLEEGKNEQQNSKDSK